MSKEMNEMTKDFEEFRKHELSVGEILDTSAYVMADMANDDILSAIDMLKIPMVIVRILKEVIENKEKENEDGTEKD